MSLIDEKYVEEAAPYNANPFVILKKKGLRRAVLLAASLCLLVAILVGTLLGMLQKETPKEPEFVDGPLYTYEEFAELTAEDPNIMGVPTNKYTKVTVKDPNALQATSLHFDEPALIYDYITVRKDLNENELKAFSDPIVERYCNMVGESVPEYGFWGQTRYDGEEVIRNDVENNEIGTKTFSMYQYQDHHSISFFVSALRPTIEDCKLALDGVPIQVDQRKSDEELMRDLEPIKKKLFELFGVEFSDIQIQRRYDEYDKTYLDYLSITFYNSTDHELNDVLSVLSDCIVLSFDNVKRLSSNTTSDTILYNATIRYEKFRSEPYERCYATKKVNLLDLKIAEEYLSKGYVIGGYACPLCTAFQEKIDFEEYDFVCVRYRICKDAVIPFYNFYKRIEGDTYALTSVPAIEIEGYAEHFEQVQSNHEHKTQ
jgi:hypothetical protein